MLKILHKNNFVWKAEKLNWKHLKYILKFFFQIIIHGGKAGHNLDLQSRIENIFKNLLLMYLGKKAETNKVQGILR